MAVALVVDLPDQPAGGSAVEVPLAGNGYWSPHSETHVTAPLPGDASGGLQTITVSFDPRWTSIIAFCQLEIDSLGAPRNVTLRTQMGPDMFDGIVFNVQGLTSPGGIGALSPTTWYPVPQFYNFSTGQTPPNIVLTKSNVDSEDVVMHLLVYNFKIDAAKRVPLQVLYSCLPRGSSGVSAI